MLEPNRVARVLGCLIFAKGALLILFWKILEFIIATGLQRYGNASGKMAKFFFQQDKALADLLKFGSTYSSILLVLGIIISVIGVLFIAFPKQTVHILSAFRILRICRPA
jgi:hypothetical protein